MIDNYIDIGFMQIRAFAGWPGTIAKFQISTPAGETTEEFLKIIKAKIATASPQQASFRPSLEGGKQSIRVLCGSSASEGVLEILEVQPSGKKVMAIGAFLNGLQNKSMSL